METNSQTPEQEVISEEEQAHNEAIENSQQKQDGLPSDAEQEKEQFDMFSGMSDEWKEANLTDGKLFGKFDNIEAIAKSYKKLNDERAESGANAKQEAEKISKEEIKANVSNEQLNNIAQNGFDITEENYKAFEEAGISRLEAENMAYKMERAANQAYNMVGGKEKYGELMEWAGENLTQEEIDTFADKTVSSNFKLKDTSKMAIEWLQMKMNNSNVSDNKQSKRISGNTANTTHSGYTSNKEYEADYMYLRKNPNDRQAQRAYEEKMKNTDFSNLR